MAGVTSNYTYDKIYELTQVTQGANTTESYSYDPVGNRTASLAIPSYTVNSSNEMMANSNASYTYDQNGNTTSKTTSSGTTNYTWDFENRLKQVAMPGTGGTVNFLYDPFGRRIQKAFTQNGATTTTNYVYDGDNAIETTNQGGGLLSRFAQGQGIDEPLAESTSSGTDYYEADGLGSITSLTNGAGTVAQTYTYDSFGNTTHSTGSVVNPFQYTARGFDSETGLYYYRARYYDPSTGTWMSEDPIRFAAGPDFYDYVQNYPVGSSDPWGLAAKSCSAKNCVPRDDLSLELRLQLKLMSLASKLTGVSYYVGVQGSYARTGGGFGASGGLGTGYATDPQGNEGIVYSASGAATLGTPGFSAGIQVGGATYQNISGFGGSSYGAEVEAGDNVVYGFGGNRNSSGIFTYADIGAGKKTFDASRTVSYGKVLLICP